jgi:GalNAc-alpha-(1->4)-GalNAc-alpha-(1->3)-diNAcBac-PP-undecaprenol alpha-1,4-N-acetyl-D-galactosaminyltransferase
MRILLVTSSMSEGGGVTRVISNLAAIFAEFPDVEVDLLHAREFKGFRYPMPPGIRLLEGKHPFAQLTSLNLLVNLLRMRLGRYDYVLSFWTQENFLTCLAFLGSSSRVLLSEHLSHDQHTGLIQAARRCLYPLADKLLVLNEAELVYYRRFMKNVQLVPNPAISGRPGTLDLGVKENLIIGVGHLTRRKGFDYFVRACARARISEIGWRAVIIGEGPERAKLLALISELNASEYIEVVPPTNRIEAWYKRARVIVVSSLTEVFSMTIAESMAYGVVPVAFAADGPSYILRDHAQSLVPLGDSDGLATALACAMRDPELPARALSLRREALGRFSLDVISSIWKGLLGAR